MKTNYQNISQFEIAVVTMIAIGFVVIGFMLFSSLTPIQQSKVSAAFDIFDIHQQVGDTAETVQFISEIPNNFYQQFYIAFAEVATLPSETFEYPAAVVMELYRNLAVSINNLTDQVADGYAIQFEEQDRTQQLHELAYDGKVMGAMIDLSDKISSIAVSEQTVPAVPNFHYEYQSPKLDSLLRTVDTYLK